MRVCLSIRVRLPIHVRLCIGVRRSTHVGGSIRVGLSNGTEKIVSKGLLLYAVPSSCSVCVVLSLRTNELISNHIDHFYSKIRTEPLVILRAD